MSEQNEERKQPEKGELVISGRVRKLFDIVIGATIPVVLSVLIGFLDRVSDLEHYRDLDEYRMGELRAWKDNGGYREHAQDVRNLSALAAELLRRVAVLEEKHKAAERAFSKRHGGAEPDN